jgi:transcriptional regulator
MGQKQGDPQSREMVQGTLEMLILKTLALEPMHGYGVAQRIEQISAGVFRVNPGSLLPALSRMERSGRVKSEWRATENNRRAKYYQLTPAGRKALKEETNAWGRQTAAISKILEA